MKLEAFVVSDLHLGAGPAEPDLEDFDQDDHLARFVERIARPGVTLIINGDFIDFPQIPPYAVGPADHLLWDEDASLTKVKLTLAAHPRPFEALATFVKNGGELRMHVGNHDLDLAWPAVQERLCQAVRGAVRFELSHSLYHGVHVEHGHMFTPENAPSHATELIHIHPAPGGERRYLERVWGTDFMLQFYNDLERKNPFADNVKPMLTAAYYGVKNRWVGGRDIVRLLLFLKRSGVPWAGVGSAVLDGGASEVHVPESIADDAWRQVLGERMATDDAFREELHQVVKSLPPEQQALLTDPKVVKLEVADAEPESHGATLGGLFREERQLRAARERLKANGVTHVVFGHTHEVVNGELDGCLFNPGTWLPHLDFNRADVKAKIKAHGLTLDMLRDATLYDRARTVAHIVPDPAGRSRVELVLADDVT